MHREVAGAGRDLEGAVGAAVDRAEAALGRGCEAAPRDELGDAVVAGAHHAADGLRSVAQGRRPPHHLDLVGGEGIDGDGMVLAQRRHVVRADAVLLDAHPVVVEAADDGPVGARRERRAGDAGPVLQRVGEIGARRGDDLAFRHQRQRHEHVVDDHGGGRQLGLAFPLALALGRRTGGGRTPLDGAGRRHRDPRQVHLACASASGWVHRHATRREPDRSRRNATTTGWARLRSATVIL